MQNLNAQRNKRILIISLVVIFVVFGLVVFLLWRSKNKVDENISSSDSPVMTELQNKIEKHDEEAVEELESLVATDPEDTPTLLVLALSYAEKGLKEQERGNSQEEYVNKALDIIEKLKVKEPNNSEVYRIEGYIYEIKPDLFKAITSYEKALEISPEDPLIYAGLGHAEMLMGAVGNAYEYLNKAKDLDPDGANEMVYSLLCSIEYGGSNYDRAVEYCEKVVNNENADTLVKVDSYSILAMVYLDSNLDESKKYVEKAFALSPNNSNLFVISSKISNKAGDFDKAIEEANKSIELTPTKAHAHLSLAEALFSKGDFEKALISARTGSDLVDSDVSLLIGSKSVVKKRLYSLVADCYEKLGDEMNRDDYKNRASEI